MIRLAYVIILIGLCLFGDAVHDQHRGIASAATPGGGPGLPNTAKFSEDPQGFHNLMLYQWIRASLVLGSGFILIGFCRRADRLDPFSPDFAGDADLDELDRTLTNEREKRRRPIQ